MHFKRNLSRINLGSLMMGNFFFNFSTSVQSVFADLLNEFASASLTPPDCFPKVWTNDMRIKWRLGAPRTCRGPGNRSASSTACRASHLGRGAPIHIYGCAFCQWLTPHHNCRHVSFHPMCQFSSSSPQNSLAPSHRHALSQPRRRLLHRLDVRHVDGKVLSTGAQSKTCFIL